MEETNKFELADITEQHKAVYDFNCKLGTFKLVALTRMRMQAITKEQMIADPLLEEQVKEADYLTQVLKHPHGKLSAEEAARLAELNRAIDEHNVWLQIECFKEPRLTHPDQLEALSSELDKDEWDQLVMMLYVLVTPMAASAREKALAEVSIQYNLPMTDDLTADNMTVHQAVVYEEVQLEKQREAIEIADMMKGQ